MRARTFRFCDPENAQWLKQLTESYPQPEYLADIFLRIGIPVTVLNSDLSAPGKWHQIILAAQELQLIPAFRREFDFHDSGARMRSKMTVAQAKYLSTSGRSHPSSVSTQFLEASRQGLDGVFLIRAFFGKQEQLGTGFRVGTRLVVTSHHVVFRNGVAANRMELWLRYFDHREGQPSMLTVVHFTPEVLDSQRSNLQDFAVLRCTDLPRWVPTLLPAQQAPREGDRATIIHHPEGGPQEVSLYNNAIRFVDDNVVEYLADTANGSSGAPVFNKYWEVIAMHTRSLSSQSNARRLQISAQAMRMEPIVQALNSIEGGS